VGALGPLGFERYVLEDLAIAEQIELFHDAEFVVAPHGAGLANLVFGTGASVLELFPSRWAVPHYYLLSRACGHRYAALHANGRHRNSNFHVDVAAALAVVEGWLSGEISLSDETR
jgi:capsular polysaccharide biosynthesis protein